MPIRLNVNGRQLNLTIELRVTLLDAFRMRADLTGNKRGCDRGACGACTMLVDGRPVDTLHPVQQAFCENDALCRPAKRTAREWLSLKPTGLRLPRHQRNGA